MGVTSSSTVKHDRCYIWSPIITLYIQVEDFISLKLDSMDSMGLSIYTKLRPNHYIIFPGTFRVIFTVKF